MNYNKINILYKLNVEYFGEYNSKSVPTSSEVSIANELFKQMKELILETVFDKNDTDSLEFTHETRSEEITSIDFESVDKTWF
jgi:hypothetical protein